MKPHLDELKEILLKEEELKARVKELGEKITQDYRLILGKDLLQKPLIAVGLLRGALLFLADLARAIAIPLEYDFICVSSYGKAAAPGELKLLKDLEVSIAGRHVLVVEDIVDTGQTLDYIKKLLLARDPASLKICCLLDKIPRRKVKVDIDYVGFTIKEDAFLVGYGLDYAERYRNLPYVAALKPEVIRKSSNA